MTILKNLIIAVLLMITTMAVSAAVTTYAKQKDLARDYGLLERRYTELHSYMMREQVASFALPVEC